ncbi:MAG: hypothetical protein AB7O98_12030 [Hyphomonadaceae bacterium]
MLSDRSLAQLACWAGFWLAYLGDLFAGAGVELWFERAAAPFVREVRGLIERLVVVHAHRRWRGRFVRVYGPKAYKQARRAVLGAHLRRALRARDLRTQIAKARAALRNIGALVTHMLRRLAHGMSRILSRVAVRTHNDAARSIWLRAAPCLNSS